MSTIKKILYCPNCKTEDLDFDIHRKDFENISTSIYIGDKIVQYVICPHCNYILAGTRDIRGSQEKNEIELFLLKEYTDKDGMYIQGATYENLMNKANKRIREKKYE